MSGKRVRIRAERRLRLLGVSTLYLLRSAIRRNSVQSGAITQKGHFLVNSLISRVLKGKSPIHSGEALLGRRGPEIRCLSWRKRAETEKKIR